MAKERPNPGRTATFHRVNRAEYRNAVRDLRYGHAVTDTAPGHAALYTGATPRASGIVANETPPLAGCGGPSPQPITGH